MAEEQSSPNNTDKIPRLRSPNYPYIGLEDALERVGQINTVGRGHGVTAATARATWNYQRNAGDRTIGALRAYGLVDVTGEGEKRQVKPSEAAIKILENHSQRNALLKQAALAPELYKDVWAKYSGVLPADPVIYEYLRWDKKFNPDNIEKFLRDFRATITFANLSESDKMEAETEDEPPAANESGKEDVRSVGGVTPKKNTPPTLNEGVMYSISIEVGSDGTLSVTGTGAVTSETFGLLSKVYELKEKFEQAASRKRVGAARNVEAEDDDDWGIPEEAKE